MAGTTKVQERASLHEKAVQAIARGEVDPCPAPRRKGVQNRSGDVRHLQVDPKVWSTARTMLADEGNTYTRIEIISSFEVVLR